MFQGVRCLFLVYIVITAQCIGQVTSPLKEVTTHFMVTTTVNNF